MRTSPWTSDQTKYASSLRARCAVALAVVATSALIASAACKNQPPTKLATALATNKSSTAVLDASPPLDAPDDATPDACAPDVDPVRPADQTGPFEIPFLGARNVYFTVPSLRGPARLLAMLHGLCNPPGYTCGWWQQESKDLGFLVCPTGDGSCGPTMANAPTWTESWSKMDDDLELAIDKVSSLYPGQVRRDDSVLLGFSRGAYVAPSIAGKHPGRWPYVVLIEANVSLSVVALRRAGVRAVAMLAGEFGNEIRGEKSTVDALQRAGYPAKLWAMPGAGHFYSNNIASLLTEAIDWVTTHGEPPQDAGNSL